MSLDCGWKPDNLEKTPHRLQCKGPHRTAPPQPGLQLRFFSLFQAINRKPTDFETRGAGNAKNANRLLGFKTHLQPLDVFSVTDGGESGETQRTET